jgi:hypothetical protein
VRYIRYMNEITFTQVSQITQKSPLECLKAYRNLQSDFAFDFGEEIKPVNQDSLISASEAELLIMYISKKSLLSRLIEHCSKNLEVK